MPNPIILPSAEADLVEIWFYTWEKWGVRQADKYQNELRATFALLGEHPGIARPYKKDSPLLRYTSGKHTVFLRRTGKAIEIVHVLHGKMNLEEHL